MDFLAFILASQAGLSVAKVRFKRSTASRGGMPFTMGPLRSYSARKRTTSFGVATTWTVWSSLPIKGWPKHHRVLLEGIHRLDEILLVLNPSKIEGVTPATKLKDESYENLKAGSMPWASTRLCLTSAEYHVVVGTWHSPRCCLWESSCWRASLSSKRSSWS